MMDEIHIDEKWFYLTRLNQTVYLTPGEEPPERRVKSKKYIPKVMFLCAVACPRYDCGRKQWFNGKIGMWPLVEQVAAVRNSQNRPAGDKANRCHQGCLPLLSCRQSLSCHQGQMAR